MAFSKLGKNKRKMLAGAAVVPFSLAAGMPAYAQENDDDRVVEEVVVSGLRQSIRNALELKRGETSIVEAVSAEDIGKLPDQSIAESIARLPGLAAQRLRGRAQVISVRGLGPDFTTALLNGREQVTAGDNRGVEFDQYPAELLSQVVVYKTPDASLIGQGLAGTADLRTIRPLKQKGRTLSFNARYEWNGDGALNTGSEDAGIRITGAYIDQFADDTIGVVLGVATQTSPTQAERWEAWGYPTVGPNDDLVLGGAKPYAESRELSRDAILGTIEFQPNDRLSSSIDVFYSQFEDVGLLRGIELPLQWGGATLQDGFTAEDGLVTAGTFDGVQAVTRNDTRFREADVLSLGFNTTYSFNERWTGEVDLGFSGVDRDDVDLETYTGTAAGFGNGASDTLGFGLGESGSFVFDSILDYTNPSTQLLTDPQGWGQAGFIKRPSTEDELTTLRLSADRYMGGEFFDSVEFGVNYSTRDKSKRSAEAFLDLANPDANGTTPVPANLLQAPTRLGFLGIDGVISYDPEALLASGVYNIRPNTNPDVITKRWDVSEDVLLAYVQANVNAVWGDTPVRGNFGVQVVNTDQSSVGPAVQGNQFVDFTDGDDYTEVLPSANFSFEIADNTFIRASAARTLMRARMDQLRASQELNLNLNVCNFDADGNPTFDAAAFDVSAGQVCLSSSGGSPQLRPYLATALDLTFEKYFADQSGYVSVAAFYKNLDDFIFGTSAQAVDYTDLATTVFGADFVAANPDITTGILDAPTNTDGGTIQGFELAVSLTGDQFLPAPFDGFGVLASYSYTDSEVQPDGEPEPITIPGLSERVASGTIFYEKMGFQARVSYRYRSEFLGEVTGFGANREFRELEAESVVDAQIGYQVQSGPLEGATFVLQGYNLTDEEFLTTVNGDDRQVRDFQSYGRTYLFGVNYKL